MSGTQNLWVGNFSNNDGALIRLNNNIPAGYSPYYAGWNKSSSSPGNNVVGIHHPDAWIKKISYNASGMSSNGNWWDFRYNSGRVIPGSSGSPMFDSSKRVRGMASYIYTDYCSPSPDCYCAQTYYHGYAKFSSAWNYIDQYLDPIMNVYTPVEEIPSVLASGVAGSVDNGIQTSFRITDDKFALGSPTLVNHKTYYYMSIAYGFNPAEINAHPYDVNNPLYDGRNQPHISGRRNIQTYSAIPHQIDPENGGTLLGASYGDGVKITRIEGSGNGGGILDLTESTVDDILLDGRSLFPEYDNGKGPITVSVVDPLYMVEVTKIKTGIMPHGSRISKDGKYHYSVAMMSGELFEIDAMDLSVNRILSLDNNNNLRNAKSAHTQRWSIELDLCQCLRGKADSHVHVTHMAHRMPDVRNETLQHVAVRRRECTSSD